MPMSTRNVLASLGALHRTFQILDTGFHTSKSGGFIDYSACPTEVKSNGILPGCAATF